MDYEELLFALRIRELVHERVLEESIEQGITFDEHIGEIDLDQYVSQLVQEAGVIAKSVRRAKKEHGL